MMAKLELVRKRREAQAKQRIAKDGWDRMKPMSADNHPPGTTWPPPSCAPQYRSTPLLSGNW